METEVFLLLPALCLLAGIAASLILPGKLKTASYALFAAGCLLLFFSSLQSLLFSDNWAISLPASSVLTLGFRGGGLSSYFALVLSVLGLAVSVYSIGYAQGSKRPSPTGALYGLFLLSMYAVFFSSNIPTFLISWETMSLVSYFLVTADIEDAESQRAGLVYAVMTHIGTAFIIAAFMILYSATGSLEFAGMKAALNGSGALKSLIFVLSLIGFGTKAGVVPLHTWLPRAHPAAPSNVSALMSGVMIKSGIYGIILVSIDILGGGAGWWGVLVIAVGGVSSVLGMLYALMERDIKRLLAYSSVENVGIILLGVGASMIFGASGLPALAGLSLAAALYHTLNHALFKGLLFLGAGSVMHETHTKNMEEMGGLLKRMPWTGLFFLTGSVAICALPPFNGFGSEWLTFQSLVLGIKTTTVLSKTLTLLGGAALALTGALAAACFVKAFGISFLGLPRSVEAAEANEASMPMVVGMAFLALLCLVLGVFPGYVIGVISSVPVGGLPLARGLSAEPLILSVGDGFSSLSMAALFIVLMTGGAAVYAVVRASGGRRKAVCADPWDCGIRRLTPKMQYTATAFTKPLRVIFKRIYRPKKDIRINYVLKPLFVREIVYKSEITPLFEMYLYRPFVKGLHSAALRIRRLQSGSLHLYLGYILITLVVLLVVWG